MNLPYIYLDKKRVVLYAEIASVVLLVVALGIYIIFFSQFRLVNRDSEPTATKSSAFKEREKSTFFDGTFLVYNSDKNTISVFLVKDGQMTAKDLEVAKINLNKVVYDPKTTEVEEIKPVKPADIRSGANLKIITTGADVNFVIDNVKEVQVLEPKTDE